MPLTIAPGVVLGDDLLTESFVRAAGPGGQNVNKVATAVELRLDLRRAPFPPDVIDRLRAIAGHRVTTDDVLLIDARTYRTQAQNRAAARDRLVDLIQRALVRPRVRRKTRPTAAAREQRLASKARQARLKAGRRARGDD